MLWIAGGEPHEADCVCALCREWNDFDEVSDATSQFDESETSSHYESVAGSHFVGGWQPSWWIRWVQQHEEQTLDDVAEEERQPEGDEEERAPMGEEACAAPPSDDEEQWITPRKPSRPHPRDQTEQKASKRRRRDEAPRKFVRQKLPDDSKEVLLQWAEARLDHPYPTQKDKEELCEETNLTMAQLSNWFINYRKRYWRKSR